MSESMQVNAMARDDRGKGASRRLRRQGLVPGIVYGGHEEPQAISVKHNELIQQLGKEAFYSSLLDLDIDGAVAKVVLKDLQRHPAKPFILHVDFLRVSSGDKLRMLVPLHFENEATSVGVKMGGQVSHNVTEIEVSCLPADLPEFIVVDMGQMDVGDILHASELALPEGVELTNALDPDTPVVMIHSAHTGELESSSGEAEGEDTDES
jgi:large subunit ribosomal protein L25